MKDSLIKKYKHEGRERLKIRLNYGPREWLKCDWCIDPVAEWERRVVRSLTGPSKKNSISLVIKCGDCEVSGSRMIIPNFTGARALRS